MVDFPLIRGLLGIGPLPLGITFVIGICLSIYGLVISRRANSELGMDLSGLAIAILMLGLSMMIMFKINQLEQAHKQKQEQKESKALDFSIPYVAKYNRGEGLLMLLLSFFFLGIAVYLFWEKRFSIGPMLSLGIAAFTIWRTGDIFFTKIKFTNKNIIARGLFYKEFQESYSNITDIVFRFGSMTIYFSGDCRLKIGSGLGKARVIAAFLEKYAPPSVIPRKVG